MREPEFLSVADVLLIYRQQIEVYGGISSIRDQSLLESSVLMPQVSFD